MRYINGLEVESRLLAVCYKMTFSWERIPFRRLFNSRKDSKYFLLLEGVQSKIFEGFLQKNIFPASMKALFHRIPFGRFYKVGKSFGRFFFFTLETILRFSMK